jgi:hypothetical protein
MTIQKKKGIAVLKGVDVVHKLTGDGAATIGKEGSTVTLSGAIGVESSTGDVVNMFAARDQSIASYNAQTQQWMTWTSDDHTQAANTVAALTASALAANEGQYTTFVGQGDAHETAVSGTYNTLSGNLDSSAGEAEGKLVTESGLFTANKANLVAKAVALEGRVTALDNSAIVSNISGIESLIIAASASQDGDLTNAVISLNSEISTMISSREDGDVTLDGNINTQTTTQNNNVTSLQTEVAAEQTANTALSNTFALDFDNDKISLASRYSTADSALDLTIDAAEKAMIMGDAQKAAALATAVQTASNATGSWTVATAAEEGAESTANSEASTSIIAAGQAGHTDDLRDYGDNPNSVAAETDLRAAAFDSLSNQVKSDYDNQRNGMGSGIDFLLNSIATKLGQNAAYRASIHTSIANDGIQSYTDQLNGAGGYTASLESRISTEESNENAAVVATDLLVQAQEDRLTALQDHDTDTFAEISTMVSTMSGSEATALSQEVATVVGNLGTLANNRTTGDGDESGYLTNTVIANRTVDQVAMQSLIDDAEAEMVADEGEHTSFLATEKTSLQSEINTWDTTTLSLAESTMTSVREDGDATLDSNLSTAISLREDAVSTQASLQEEDDATLSTRLDNLAVSWNGQDMTLSGHLSVGGNLAVSGEVKLGVHTTVPAAYAAGPDNGAIFYLDADDDAARVGFEKGHSWYFCENDVWFASPFSTEDAAPAMTAEEQQLQTDLQGIAHYIQINGAPSGGQAAAMDAGLDAAYSAAVAAGMSPSPSGDYETYSVSSGWADSTVGMESMDIFGILNS